MLHIEIMKVHSQYLNKNVMFVEQKWTHFSKIVQLIYPDVRDKYMIQNVIL